MMHLSAAPRLQESFSQTVPREIPMADVVIDRRFLFSSETSSMAFLMQCKEAWACLK